MGCIFEWEGDMFGFGTLPVSREDCLFLLNYFSLCPRTLDFISRNYQLFNRYKSISAYAEPTIRPGTVLGI